MLRQIPSAGNSSMVLVRPHWEGDGGTRERFQSQLNSGSYNLVECEKSLHLSESEFPHRKHGNNDLVLTCFKILVEDISEKHFINYKIM